MEEKRVVRIPGDKLELIKSRVLEVLEGGFGIVEVHIRNGQVYRIKYSKEDYIEEEKASRSKH
jgi:hypothetical protein